MRSISSLFASAGVGVLGLLCAGAGAGAQTVPALVRPVGRVASFAPGSIEGVVLDEHGAPVGGAMVSALGASTAFAVTDRAGRFVLGTLSPGPYLVRAHSSGFVASRGQVIEVRPAGRSSSSISLSREGGHPLLAAGLGSIGGGAGEPAGSVPGSTGDEDHSETAWRLRHARRSILKDATTPAGVVAEETPPESHHFLLGPAGYLGHAATSFFTATPVSGEVNLLTTGSFDNPLRLFSSDGVAHNVAYVSIGSPAGSDADWTMRGAVMQGDLSSWIVAGTYASRALAPRHYAIGLSYATERYGDANPAALGKTTGISRGAGAVYGSETLVLSPALSFTYGGRYARYGYLQHGNLVSPRAGVTIAPGGARIRINGLLASYALAPGAEEFLPPGDDTVWLPPQRTFSSLDRAQPLRAERTTHAEVSFERDLPGASTVSLRAFRQHVNGQLVTMFDVQQAGETPAPPGRYLVGNTGQVDASGWGLGFRTVIARRVHGAIEYSESRAAWNASGDLAYLLLVAPSAVRRGHDHLHEVSTSIETEVPETSTRVRVRYFVSDGFARGGRESDRPAVDARFDVQVRQALSFMNFNNARWEMLVSVRDFFREPAAGQSVYDELLVVRPPKRIVGGLTLRF